MPDFDRDDKQKLRKENWHPGNLDCECSCCAWGQKFWSKDKKMRFLFGL